MMVVESEVYESVGGLVGGYSWGHQVRSNVKVVRCLETLTVSVKLTKKRFF